MVVVFLQHVYLEINLTSIVSIVTGALKGVMRVGVLAKGLLLHERLDVNLVVLCHGEEKFFFIVRIIIDSFCPLVISLATFTGPPVDLKAS